MFLFKRVCHKGVLTPKRRQREGTDVKISRAISTADPFCLAVPDRILFEVGIWDELREVNLIASRSVNVRGGVGYIYPCAEQRGKPPYVLTVALVIDVKTKRILLVPLF